VGVLPIGLRDPLPTIPVPLLAPDPEIRLDLKAILERTYDASGFVKYIYETDPEPRLSPADATWARSLLPTTPTDG